MVGYAFYEYRNKCGIGSTKVFGSREDAIKHAETEWNKLHESDKRSYKTDSNGLFSVIHCNLVDDEDELTADIRNFDVIWSAF